QSLKETISLKKQDIINNDFTKASDYKKEEFKLMNEINNLELTLYKKITKKVTKMDVANIIHSKTSIPIYELLHEKKNILNRTETILKNNLVGQNNAIKEVTNIAKKIKLGFNDKCYSLLFAGPSGVGKTLLAKTFGENLVGSNNVIKLDMSEYKEPHSISKIVGAPPGYIGYDDNTNILEEIKNKPYSVLILDEIEKAHSDIINLFLQVLDEGKIKDSKSNTVRFDNVVIIMTSNVGFHDINVGFKKENKIKTKLNNHFSIPFMNRVDNVVIFSPLNEIDITKIINNCIKKTKEKYKGKIDIKISKNILKDIIKKSNYEQYGARKISKIIKDKIETQVIEALIENKNSVYIKEIQTV
ncbi:MAG: ATP-dependent Clp protease ATP-binding subunit, partial [Bacilli bacterium]|nr:ATP-dependent Clp protease ATP-binding subunit [Bacilli bacterium]